MPAFVYAKQTNHDFTSAEKQYGELNIRHPMGVNFIDVDVVVSDAEEWLDDFDFEEDYFIPVGPATVIAVVSMVLYEKMIESGGTSVKLLEWEKRTMSYKTVTVEGVYHNE